MKDMGFYRIAEVENITGLHRRVIYKEMAEGNFPSSVNITKGCKGWPKASIKKWYKKVIESSGKYKLKAA